MGAVATQVKALTVSSKAAKAEAVAALASGDAILAAEKQAIALADEAAAKGLLEEQAIFKATSCALAAAAPGTSAWCLPPFERGKYIHDQLEFTDYLYADGWVPIGRQLGGYFPLIDFTKDLTVVSVKTVDARSLTALSRMEAHIDDLATRGIKIGTRNPTSRILDIRIKPGQEGLLDSLKSYNNRVLVQIRVFP